MIIEVDEYFYAQDYGILGRAGEIGFRTIECTYPQVEGAQMYKLRFELEGEYCYELDVTSGSVQVPPSLLAKEGSVKTQFIATASNDDGTYTVIARSNVFYCVVGKSLDGELRPIPTYEQAQEALEDITGMLDDYEVKSEILTSEEYEAMKEHRRDTMYHVCSEDKVTLYLGDIKLMSGGILESASVVVEQNGIADLEGEIHNENEQEEV